MTDLSGPVWLHCLSDQAETYRTDIEEMDDSILCEESYRVEIEQPPSDPRWNDRDWRLFRRLIRQEMHNRGLVTPS